MRHLVTSTGMRDSDGIRGMFSDDSVDRSLERIDEWHRSMTRRAEQARDLALRTSELSVVAHSRDGLIEVTVGGDGRLTHLHVDERMRQQSAAKTARTIMETLQVAKKELIRQFDEATAETVGTDSATGRMLAESLRQRLGPLTDLRDGHR